MPQRSGAHQRRRGWAGRNSRTQSSASQRFSLPISPESWILDQYFLDLPGRKEAQVALLFDYKSNVVAYPDWQQWMRKYTPPALIVWGTNDPFFPEPGAHAYLADLPDAELHVFDTGHFALETHLAEIAPLIADFLDARAAGK